MNFSPSSSARCHKVGYILPCRVNGRKKFKALGQVNTTAPTLCRDETAFEPSQHHSRIHVPVPVRKTN